MKKFILNTLLVALLVLVASIGFRASMGLPYGWINADIYDHQVAYENNKDKYNAIILGASSVRTINPTIFNAEMEEISDIDMNLFNYAVSAGVAFEINYLYEQIMAAENTGLKYCIYQVRSINDSASERFMEKNRHTSRNRYWLNKGMYWNSLKSLFALDSPLYPIQRKLKVAYFYTENYAGNLFNIGLNGDFRRFDNVAKRNKRRRKPNWNGFYGYKGYKNKHYKRDALNKNPNSLADIFRIEQYNASIKTFQEKKFDREVNKAYLNKLLTLKTLAESKGVKLIYFIPPLLRNPEVYEELGVLYEHLPADSKIEMSNAHRFPDLYRHFNCYDAGHLNRYGSEIISRLLANEINLLLEGQGNLTNQKVSEIVDGANEIAKDKYKQPPKVTQKRKKDWSADPEYKRLIEESLKFKGEGDLENGIASATKALERNPDILKAYMILSVLYIHTENWEKAEQMCKKSISMNPRSRMAKANYQWFKNAKANSQSVTE